nr:MAG TPA: hypothetical protein [Caudoviricetes sp.]
MLHTLFQVRGADLQVGQLNQEVVVFWTCHVITSPRPAPYDAGPFFFLLGALY